MKREKGAGKRSASDLVAEVEAQMMEDMSLGTRKAYTFLCDLIKQVKGLDADNARLTALVEEMAGVLVAMSEIAVIRWRPLPPDSHEKKTLAAARSVLARYAERKDRK